MKKFKLIGSVLVLGALVCGYAHCLVNQAVADGCYRDIHISDGTCETAIDLPQYGTSGELVEAYYMWVKTTGPEWGRILWLPLLQQRVRLLGAH